MKVASVAGATALVGAVAGIAGAAASPGTSSSKAPAAPPHARPAWRQFGPPGGPVGPGPAGLGRGGIGPAVHEQAVVLNKAGTGFITATLDQGTVESVNGDQLAVKEAVRKVTYKTVTLTIPANASVYRNFAKSTLSSMRGGDHVRVVQSSEGTQVFAVDASQVGHLGRGLHRPAGAGMPVPSGRPTPPSGAAAAGQASPPGA